MTLVYLVISVIFAIITILPGASSRHWIIRIWDFIRIQALALQVILFIIGILLFNPYSITFLMAWIALFVAIIYNLIILLPYTFLYKIARTRKINSGHFPESVSIISVNVYQYNEEHHKLLDLLGSMEPDIVFTMETNEKWEKAMQTLEEKYPNYKKIAQENTYGMHFYTKLKIEELQVNYFASEDIPSLMIEMKTAQGQHFKFYGLHPPPPSPTEEKTSIKRDIELRTVMSKIKKDTLPVIIAGDLNMVCWAKMSVKFRKKLDLVDPRVGRGFVSTFHAKYKLLRFPIDLFFHTKDIFVHEFRKLKEIGSDHLPIYCRFSISDQDKRKLEKN